MILQPLIEAALPQLRAEAEARMTSRCTAKRKDNEADPVSDAHGFESQPWTVLEVDLPIRVGGYQRGASGSRAVTSGGVEVELATRVAHLPAVTTGLRDGDIIEVTSGENEGLFLRVVEATFQDQATARRLPVLEVAEPEGWTA